MALADWDARLLSPGRALELAGDWPLYATYELADLAQYGDQPAWWQINLRCRKDGQSVGLLARGQSEGVALYAESTSIGDLLSGVVRHMVTAHDLALSGANRG